MKINSGMKNCSRINHFAALQSHATEIIQMFPALALAFSTDIMSISSPFRKKKNV